MHDLLCSAWFVDPRPMSSLWHLLELTSRHCLLCAVQLSLATLRRSWCAGTVIRFCASQLGGRHALPRVAPSGGSEQFIGDAITKEKTTQQAFFCGSWCRLAWTSGPWTCQAGSVKSMTVETCILTVVGMLSETALTNVFHCMQSDGFVQAHDARLHANWFQVVPVVRDR